MGHVLTAAFVMKHSEVATAHETVISTGPEALAKADRHRLQLACPAGRLPAVYHLISPDRITLVPVPKVPLPIG